MNKRVMYHKKTGEPIQVIARAQTKPTFQEVVCYQELTSPYEYYVMESGAFFENYVQSFDKLPLKEPERIEKHPDLPEDEMTTKMMEFLDARTYADRLRILDEMKGANEHILANIAVSMDITLEDGVDSYERIRSELELRKKYEVAGDRVR